MFDSTKRPLRELLQELKKGTIQLPEFQRGWVWKNEQITCAEHIRQSLHKLMGAAAIRPKQSRKTARRLARKPLAQKPKRSAD